MTTAIITKTEIFILDLDGPCWPENMTDEEKLTGWLFAAKMEPEIAFKCLEGELTIEGKLNGRIQMTNEQEQKWVDHQNYIDHFNWVADKIVAYDDYTQEAAFLLRKYAPIIDAQAKEIAELTKLIEEAKRQRND